MIKYTYDQKNLVVPSGLGFGGAKSGGGSGDGISREEAFEIAEEVTASAITEYDIEAQVDLEEIREAVSGNTEAIGNLSDSLSAYTTDSELQQALQEYATTAQTQAISDSLTNYATTAQTQAIAGDVAELSGATQAIEQSLGNYATTADTQSIQNSLANYATTAVTDGLETEISGLSINIAALSAVTSGLVSESDIVYDYDDLLNNYTQNERAALQAELNTIASTTNRKVWIRRKNGNEYVWYLAIYTYPSGGGMSFGAVKGNVVYSLTISSLGKVTMNSRNLQNELTEGSGISISANTISISSAVTAEIAGKQDAVPTYVISTEDMEDFNPDDEPVIDAMMEYLDSFENVEDLPSVRVYYAPYDLFMFLKAREDFGRYHFTNVADVMEYDLHIQKSGDGYSVEPAVISLQEYFDVGSGFTLDFDEDIDSNVLNLKIGDGLGFSGDTLVVSGGTGGGIEKVSELPQDAEPGDMVWLEGGTFEGITILCAQSSAGYVFELDGNYYNIDGNEPTIRLGNFPMARWFAEPDNSDIKMRLRFTEDDYTILDVIDTSGTHSISGGTSAVETYEDVEFQMMDVLYVYQNGQWFRKNRIEWVYDADEAEDLIYDIYHSDKEFPLDDLVIRLDPEKRGDKREFVPYVTAYYGMDIQCTDSRGNHDWGQIKVYCYRFNFDGTLGDLVGEQMIKVESQLQHVDFFRVVVDSGGTVEADSRSQMEAFYGMHSVLNTVEFEWNGSNNAFGAAPVKYWYRQTENVGGEDKLVYYVCAEVPINGTLYRGLWVWPEWSMPDPFTPTSWTAV